MSLLTNVLSLCICTSLIHVNYYISVCQFILERKKQLMCLLTLVVPSLQLSVHGFIFHISIHCFISCLLISRLYLSLHISLVYTTNTVTKLTSGFFIFTLTRLIIISFYVAISCSLYFCISPSAVSRSLLRPSSTMHSHTFGM